MKNKYIWARTLRPLWTALMLILISVGQAAGQNRQNGEITGTVTDQTGAVIPATTVTITNILTGVSRRALTNASGVYDAPSVPEGEYTITFTKEGFERFVRTGIVLHVQTITVNAQLSVGSTSQTVTVRAPAPLVQTEASDQQTTIVSEQVSELPTVNRNWYEFTGLFPGVSGGGGQQAYGESASVNGEWNFQSNWQINGASAMFTAGLNPDNLSVPLDAISEVNALRGNFSAEYGNGLSVFSVTTRTGTNQWHGSLFEFAQNDVLQARNFFAPSKTPFRWNEFGGSVGGPLKKDKAFLFFEYQRNPTITYAPTFYTFPTEAMKSGDFSAAGLQTIYDPSTLTLVAGNYVNQPFPGNKIPSDRIDAVASKILQYFPAPNLPGLFNNYYYDPRYPLTTTWYVGRVDYNISPRNSVTGFFMEVPQWWITPAPDCEIDCIHWNNPEYQAQLTDIWSLGAAVVNEFHFSLTHNHGVWTAAGYGKNYPQQLGLANPASNIFPYLTVEGTLSTSIGSAINALDGESAFIPSDVVSLVRGRHVVKFGAEYDRWWSNGGWGIATDGNFDFNGIFTRNPADASSAGEGFADFLLGLPDTWSLSLPPATGARLRSGQFFAEDNYKATSHLTLNLGLRYIIQTGWSEAYNRLASFEPNIVNPGTGTPGAMWFAGQQGHSALENTIYDFFAPRVGFVWSPKANWSIRGGYGIYNIPWGGSTYALGMGTGYATQGYETSTDLIHPIFSLAQGPPAPIYPQSSQLTPDVLNGLSVNYTPWISPMAYVQQYQLDIQHQFRGGILVDAAYVGNKGVHLPFTRDINQVPSELLGPGNAQLNRPYPQYAGISASLWDGISNYNAFQLRVEKRFSSGLSFLANYTCSKTLDTETGSGWSGSGGGTFVDLRGSTSYASDYWQNSLNPRANYGLSMTDMPQMFNGDFIYELPVGQGKRFLDRGGTLNGFLGGWEATSIWQIHSGSPFTAVMGTANLSGSLAGTWYPNRLGSGTIGNPTINQWFNSATFAQPAPYTFGDSGRNILFGPKWKDMDFALIKKVPIRKLGEGGQLEIRMEIFDLFNNSNFGMPNASIGTAGAGVISWANTERNIQLGMKLAF